MISNKIKYLMMFVLVLGGFYLSRAQLISNGDDNKIWSLKQFSGKVSLESAFNFGQYNSSSNFVDDNSSNYYAGNFQIRSSSYFWHPNFLKVNTDFAYSPSTIQDSNTILPEHTQSNTTEKININAIFFDERIVIVSPYFSYNHGFSSREFASNSETYLMNYGTRVSSANKIINVSLKVEKNNWEKKELQTNRKFKTEYFKVNSELNKSYENFDHSLSFDFSDNKLNYSNIISENKEIKFQLKNDLQFKKSSFFTANSKISFTNRQGTSYSDKFIINENFFFTLPSNLKAYINYQFYNHNHKTVDLSLHEAGLRFEHKLYKSLNSFISYNFIETSQSTFKSQNNRGLIGFNYRKKVPTGVFRLDYSTSLTQMDKSSKMGTISVVDETYKLNDITTIFLRNPFVDIHSVIVQDSTSNFTYENNVDFVLTVIDGYIEIERIPGGQIENGSLVLIDYNYEQQNSLDFVSFNNKVATGLNLFDNFVDLYFSYSGQGYGTLKELDKSYLKTIDTKIFGLKFYYKGFEIGGEFEDFESNISPHTSIKYVMNYDFHYWNNLVSTINGYYRIYDYEEVSVKQKITNIRSSTIYMFGSNSKAKIEIGYTTRSGRQVDSEHFNMKLEYSSSFRLIDFKLGYQFYNRDLLDIKDMNSSIYASLSRTF